MKKIYNIELDYDQLNLLMDALDNAENIRGRRAGEFRALSIDIDRQATEQRCHE